MAEGYNHKEIEKKWREKWAADSIYATTEDAGKPKAYVLDMFPYPSGEGLHVGHPKGYIATDIYSRHKRMTGHSVLHPMGWDAFGLPAENYALANKIHPRIAVEKNIAHFKEQLEGIGFDYDWSREINTTNPAYYKWTQWIFLKLFEKGLAYQSDDPINWCPSCMTGLSNEDLDDGKCERCGSVVEKKRLRQWVLKITDYAERMLKDLDLLSGWPEHIKESQRNWIGRSEGAQISFQLISRNDAERTRTNAEKVGIVEVFTTRPDTLFGATYMVLAPEHPLLAQLTTDNEQLTIENKEEILSYMKVSQNKTEIERTAEGKEKTGVELKGVKAINPANQEEIPVFVADYVLGHYGTGAIMAVPAHDERDFAFAKKFNLPIRPVVLSGGSVQVGWSLNNYADEWNDHYANLGKLWESGKFTGLKSEEAKQKITEFVGGKLTVQYKLRDWVFSRQRYWGEPIPLIFCENCKKTAEVSSNKHQVANAGWIPVPEDQLPVLLPEVESYEPSGTGESPLANIAEWVNVPCPKCGGEGKRETNTMPQWAGSSWYYIAYCISENIKSQAPISKQVAGAEFKERTKYWLPVDMYVGGAEHATRHLIYARFWHKFLQDVGVVSTPEPFMSLHSVGIIIAEDGRKMSKRFGNVINPDSIVEEYGADTLRGYEMFMGPFENAIAWNTQSLVGSRRFLERVWRYAERCGTDAEENAELNSILHRTIKKVGEDIEAFKFNTAISQMMIFLNAAEKEGSIGVKQWNAFLQLLAPFAPHVCEELWAKAGNESSVHLSTWPEFDPAQLAEDTVTVAVQINGKLRGTVEAAAGIGEEELIAAARGAVGERLVGAVISRTVVVPKKLVNFVVENSPQNQSQ